MTDRPQLLLLSLGTTRGWQLSDRQFAAQLEQAGAAVHAVGVGFGVAGALRRGYPANDFVEALASRRALHSALSDPGDAVVISTTTAAMLAPEIPVPFAVRLDCPAALNRPGARNAAVRMLERRWLSSAQVVLPMGQAAKDALPDGGAEAIVVPPAVVPSGAPPEQRERLAVAYVPDPKAKGLDLLCAAWAQASVAGARLVVFGVDRESALAHLARTGVPEPPAVEWRGMTAKEEFRGALRNAWTYVGAARWEDFGQAPLEALADGALLATVPSGGPFEALAIARSLEPTLVAAGVEAESLGRAIRAAFALDDTRARAYREGAAESLAAYRPAAIQETLERRVLPALLGRS